MKNNNENNADCKKFIAIKLHDTIIRMLWYIYLIILLKN